MPLETYTQSQLLAMRANAAQNGQGYETPEMIVSPAPLKRVPNQFGRMIWAPVAVKTEEADNDPRTIAYRKTMGAHLERIRAKRAERP